MTTRLLTCPVPTSISPLNPNGFMFSITRIPEVSFFCQEVNLPSVSMQTPEIATPFASYPIAGDRVEFGDLNVQFLIDEKMENYKAVFNWLRGLGFPENNDQYTEQIRSSNTTSEVSASYSDAVLSILGGGSIPVQVIRFVDVLPVSLDSLTFVSTNQDVQYSVGNATFKYAYYKFE